MQSLGGVVDPGKYPMKLKAPEAVSEAFVQLAMASEIRDGEIVSAG